MEIPTEKDQIHGAYIYGALTDGPTFAILSPAEQEIARAAARVAQVLGTKAGVLPGFAAVKPGSLAVPAETYYDKSSTHGACMERAIINTLARSHVIETGVSTDHILERSIYGEILAQGEARHVLAVAEGRTPKEEAGQYGLTGEIVGRSQHLKNQMRDQSFGKYDNFNEADRMVIDDDIMNTYMGPEERTKIIEMKALEGKPNYGAVMGHEDLEFNQLVNSSRVHNLLTHDRTTGNSDIDMTIRAVHNQMAAPASAMRRANPQMDEGGWSVLYHQELQAGARLLHLAEKGAEFTPRQAAHFMINDMAIMHAGKDDHIAGKLHLQNMEPYDDQKINAGDYSDLSDSMKNAIHSRLVHQHYAAPGLYQGACTEITEKETVPGLMSQRQRNLHAMVGVGAALGR